MSATNVLGRAFPRLVQSTILLPTGKKSVVDIDGNRGLSAKHTPTGTCLIHDARFSYTSESAALCMFCRNV